MLFHAPTAFEHLVTRLEAHVQRGDAEEWHEPGEPFLRERLGGEICHEIA